MEDVEIIVFDDGVENKRTILENRLIDFTLGVDKLCLQMPNTRSGIYIADQLLRSAASPAFNYGEAQSAESRKDFIHKMKICLKELREANVALKFVKRANFEVDTSQIDALIRENNELVSIFIKSIQTAKRNLQK